MKSKASNWLFGLLCVALAGAVISECAGDLKRAPVEPKPQAAAPQPAPAPAEPEAPIKLSAAQVPKLREYFVDGGYRFEHAPPDNKEGGLIGTFQNGKSSLEFVGLTGLKQATVRYTLDEGNPGGNNVMAIMYLMQHVHASEADVAWALDAARKGEPVKRTIKTVTYTVQAGPDGTHEFIMQPAPGFE